MKNILKERGVRMRITEGKCINYFGKIAKSSKLLKVNTRMYSRGLCCYFVEIKRIVPILMQSQIYTAKRSDK